jgi:hypothetical protein
MRMGRMCRVRTTAVPRSRRPPAPTHCSLPVAVPSPQSPNQHVYNRRGRGTIITHRCSSTRSHAPSRSGLPRSRERPEAASGEVAHPIEGERRHGSRRRRPRTRSQWASSQPRQPPYRLRSSPPPQLSRRRARAACCPCVPVTVWCAERGGGRANPAPQRRHLHTCAPRWWTWWAESAGGHGAVTLECARRTWHGRSACWRSHAEHGGASGNGLEMSTAGRDTLCAMAVQALASSHSSLCHLHTRRTARVVAATLSARRALSCTGWGGSYWYPCELHQHCL